MNFSDSECNNMRFRSHGQHSERKGFGNTTHLVTSEDAVFARTTNEWSDVKIPPAEDHTERNIIVKERFARRVRAGVGCLVAGAVLIALGTLFWAIFSSSFDRPTTFLARYTEREVHGGELDRVADLMEDFANHHRDLPCVLSTDLGETRQHLLLIVSDEVAEPHSSWEIPGVSALGDAARWVRRSVGGGDPSDSSSDDGVAPSRTWIEWGSRGASRATGALTGWATSGMSYLTSPGEPVPRKRAALPGHHFIHVVNGNLVGTCAAGHATSKDQPATVGTGSGGGSRRSIRHTTTCAPSATSTGGKLKRVVVSRQSARSGPLSLSGSHEGPNSGQRDGRGHTHSIQSGGSGTGGGGGGGVTIPKISAVVARATSLISRAGRMNWLWGEAPTPARGPGQGETGSTATTTAQEGAGAGAQSQSQAHAQGQGQNTPRVPRKQVVSLWESPDKGISWERDRLTECGVRYFDPVLKTTDSLILTGEHAYCMQYYEDMLLAPWSCVWDLDSDLYQPPTSHEEL